jgi:hypothetical protein
MAGAYKYRPQYTQNTIGPEPKAGTLFTVLLPDDVSAAVKLDAEAMSVTPEEIIAQCVRERVGRQ